MPLEFMWLVVVSESGNFTGLTGAVDDPLDFSGVSRLVLDRVLTEDGIGIAKGDEQEVGERSM